MARLNVLVFDDCFNQFMIAKMIIEKDMTKSGDHDLFIQQAGGCDFFLAQ